MNKKVMLLILLISTVTLLGCETGRGFGKDVENTGKNIQDTVEHND